MTEGNASGTVIAYFNLEIENKGSEKIDIFLDPPVLVANTIEYDGHRNGVSQYYCVTTDDVNSGISPLETKEYNYCIFNVPASFMNQSSIQLKIEIYGEEYVYTIK